MLQYGQKFFDFVSIALLISAVIISGIAFSESVSDESKNEILNKLSEEPLGTTGKLIPFLVSYQIITPAIPYDWFGDPDHHVPFIEEFPLLDSREIIPLFFVWLLFAFITAQIWSSGLPAGKKLLILASLWIIGTFLVWIIIKLAAYAITYNYGEDLGLSRGEIDAMRTAEWETTNQLYNLPTYISLGFLFSAIMYISLRGSMRNGSK